MKIRMEDCGFFPHIPGPRGRATRKGWIFLIVFVGILIGLIAGAMVESLAGLALSLVGLSFPFVGGMLFFGLAGMVAGGVAAFAVGRRLLPKEE